MPLGQFGSALSSEVTTKELADAYSKLSKEVQYLLNGGLDTLNVNELNAEVIISETITTDKLAANSISTEKLQAGAVTADKITVAQLSAITADLGTITAGLVQSIQMISSTIKGSEIMTRDAGSYPRAQMSSTQNMFSAEASANGYVQMVSDYLGEVALFINSALVTGQIRPFNNVLLINTASGNGDIQVSSGGNLDLVADLIDSTKVVSVNSWSRFVNRANNRTLQQDLNNLQNQINNLDARVTALGG